jgi:hypothetical protein
MTLNQQVIKSALIFALVCPALIWAASVVYFLINTNATNGASSGDWLSPYVAMLAFLTLVSAYVAAVGPSLAVGAAFGWVHGRRAMSSPIAAVVGFGLGFIVAFSVAHAFLRVDATVSGPPVVVGLAGGLSSLVSALIALRRLGANNSFKPSPHQGGA